jgi:hypothetical protein
MSTSWYFPLKITPICLIKIKLLQYFGFGLVAFEKPCCYKSWSLIYDRTSQIKYKKSNHKRRNK